MSPLRTLFTDPTVVKDARSPRAAKTQDQALSGFSETQLRFLAESIPQIAWTAQPDGYIDFMNGRWFDYTGLTEEETYKELKSAVHPDDYERYRTRWARSVKTLEPYEMQYRFRRHDGEYRWHLGRGLPVFNQENRVMKWFGTCTDIHVQKEMEENMRRMNERLEFLIQKRTVHLSQEIEERMKTEQRYLEQLNLLQRMINTLPMAAAAVNSKGKILHANALFRTMFTPLSEKHAVIDATCETVLQETAAKFPSPGWASLSALMHLHEAFTHEVAVADGRTFSFEYAPAGGERGNFLLLVRDVTSEKRAEGVKAEFMSLASHQLRTPLTAIRWALSRLQKMLQSRMTPDERRLFEKTRESAATMAQTIQMMLSVSRVEEGLHMVTPKMLSIQKFLQDVQEHYADVCRAKELRCTVECPKDLLLMTDTLILGEILENLMSNAVKYTPAGGSIHLSAATEGKHVRIEVRDTGLGIPKNQQDKIFTKFFRAENVLRVDTQGTGLGLYLAWKLAKMLQGSIDFTSKTDRGTSFILRLPAQGFLLP